MRPIIVSVGPLANASPNNIATSQTPPAAGAVTATITSGNPSIVVANTAVAGDIVTFTGAVLPAGLQYNFPYFVSSTGLSSAALQVSASYGGAIITPGAGQSGTQSVVFTTNPGLNGTLVNSAGVAVLDTPRRILITTTDTTTTFTITGTSPTGSLLTESFLVVGGATYSALDYATVTSITTNQQPTAALTIGTNGIASSAWVRLDEWANTQVTIQCDVTGNVNYTVQSSMDDPNSVYGTAVLPAAVDWIATNDLTVVGATTSEQSNFLFTPVFARILMNSGNGSVTAQFAQSNVVAY